MYHAPVVPTSQETEAQEFWASLGNTARVQQTILRIKIRGCPSKLHPFSTLGCKDPAQGQLLKDLMQTPNFRITVVQEVDTVEICGALKVRGYGDGFGVRRSPPAGPAELFQVAGTNSGIWAASPLPHSEQGIQAC